MAQYLGNLPFRVDDVPENWKSQSIYVLFTGFLIYNVLLGIYRLTLHPLSNIPGPKLAAFTYWYEIYYEVFLGGKYFHQILEMHQQYGPIVRINPNEIHFNDPDFIDSIYAGPARKTTKPLFVGRRTGTPNSIIATVDHDLHRVRRNSINSFFSVASIGRLEPIIVEKTEALLERLKPTSGSSEEGRKGKILQMHHVFKAYASDVITTYAFGDSFHFMDEKDYGNDYFGSTDKYFSLTHVFGHFPVVMRLINACPAWILGIFIPNLKVMAEKQMWWLNRVRTIRASPNPDEIKSTIFEGILASSLPPEEKTDVRMAHDAQLVGLAGEGTTAYTLTAAIYELLAHPEELKKVKDELAAAIPKKGVVPTYSDVSTLPYFNAMIQEILRLHPGVLSRMQRISPIEPIVYKDKVRGQTYVLPPGTCTSMSVSIAHMNPDVFEDPTVFRPQRWLDNPKLIRGFIGFSRGTRNCVGMNLARREMGIVLATILNTYELYQGQEGRTLELYETVRERDIDASSEMIVPFPAKGSYGLRVRVRY
ncbi:cytochrome P450 [Penicillium robsamsonii]|uniref:cytochrome P450 n=1 Tax=Penicillium robsamsonii TaxID=1792511 RepID=UPI002547D821|nr:cytochrome P450 [Penicillium robsamsonii]KAJ5811087.1 cytochrome P450 [Penicillium robsamsonii]